MEPADYIKIIVTDTGGGIPEETLPLIFEPYFTTKEEGKGTGLGLPIVKKSWQPTEGRFFSSKPGKRGHIYCQVSH